MRWNFAMIFTVASLAIAFGLGQPVPSSASTQPTSDSTAFAPAVITMHYKDAPLTEVLDDFVKQAGGDIGIHDAKVAEYAKTAIVSIDLEKANFWDSMDALLNADQLHCTNGPHLNLMVPFRGGGSIAGNGNSGLQPNATVVGLFHIVPETIEVDHSFDYNSAASQEMKLTFTMDALFEPKLEKVTGPINRDWIKECVDDKGNSLLAPEGQDPVDDSFWMEVKLKEPPNMGTKIAHFRGEMHFIAQAKSEFAEFDDLSKIQEISRKEPDDTITLHQFTPAKSKDQSHSLSITVTVNDANAPEALGTRLEPSIHLYDTAGKEIRGNNGPRIQHGNQFDLNMSFDNDPSSVPAKLRWEVTTEIHDLIVPIKFDDLPLP
jgi:hypothetical protein